MKEDTYYHPYSLKSVGSLNARSQGREIEGCLIRVGSGFACIQPWPDLGDQSLEDQLKGLKEGKPYRLGRRALHCANVDGLARESEVSLFDGLAIPDSHLTVVPGLDLKKQKVELFSRIKLKGSADLIATREEARRCLSMANSDCRLRIDFNEVLDHSEAMNLAQALGEDICERIDFIEDPTRFDFENWSGIRRQTGLPLAVDRCCEAAVAEEAEIDYLIIKPAVVDPGSLCSKMDDSGGEHLLLVTSYMDHAMGQLYAAYEAALLRVKYGDRVRECGLLTHELFESDEFFESIKCQGPKLIAPGGTGLGFDDQLAGLSWKKL